MVLDPSIQKKGIQLKFKDIFITTVPKEKKLCKKRNYKPQEPKVIINHVSGAVNPG